MSAPLQRVKESPLILQNETNICLMLYKFSDVAQCKDILHLILSKDDQTSDYLF